MLPDFLWIHLLNFFLSDLCDHFLKYIPKDEIEKMTDVSI